MMSRLDVRNEVRRLATTDGGLYTLQVSAIDNCFVEKRTYSGYFIADMLLKIKSINKEYDDDVSLDLIDNQTGEILYGQYPKGEKYGAIAEFLK